MAVSVSAVSVGRPRLASILDRSPAISALRVPEYRLFWLSAAGGGFGLNLWFLAAAWLVLERTDSQLAVGLVGGLAAVPSLILSLLGGALSDRVDRRRILVGALVAFALLALISGALESSDVVESWHILLIAAGIGLADAVSHPAWHTLVVDLIGTKRLLAANALGQIGEFLGEVVAPLLAGLLLAASGPAPVFYLAGGVLSLAALLMIGLQNPRPVPRQDEPRPLLEEIRSGLAYTLRTPPFPALLAISASSIFAAAVFPLLPVYARDELEVGAEGFGVLAASLAAGMVSGAVLMAALGQLPRPGWSLLGARAVWFAAMAGFAVCELYALSILLLFAMGLAGAIANNLILTRFQIRADERMRGRVMGIVRIAESFEPLGFVVGGALASALGNQTALLLCAAAGAAVLVTTLALSASIRSE